MVLALLDILRGYGLIPDLARSLWEGMKALFLKAFPG